MSLHEFIAELAMYFALVHKVYFPFTDHFGRINSTTPVLNLEYKHKQNRHINKDEGVGLFAL